MRYLLDTNHLSPIITFNNRLRLRILEELDKGHEFYIPSLVLSEFLFGILSLPRATANEAEWQRLDPEFEHIAIDKIDGLRAAKIRIALRQKGRQLHVVDALIAAVALRNDLILLTTDRDFSAIPQLNQENWLL